jgi:PPOX class probable F420-dependent enzyme
MIRTMAEALDPRVRELLRGPNFAHVATIGASGAPQTTAVWVLDEDDLFTIYKELSAVALANLRRAPRVAVSITDFDDPYLGATIRGRVAEIDETEPGAQRWLRARAFEYTGADFPAADLPEAGALIHFEVERQSWYHFDSMRHRPGPIPDEH